MGVEVRPNATEDVHQLAAAIRASVPSIGQIRIELGGVRLTEAQARHLQLDSTMDIAWDTSVIRHLRNRGRLGRSDIELAQYLKRAPVQESRDRILECHMLEILDDHQVKNVAVMTVPESTGACVFDEQGTGKTVSLIAAFDVLVERNEADRLLIVAPKSMVGEWAGEIEKFTNGLYKVETLEGNRREKAAMLHSGADVLVCNYETVSSLSEDLRIFCSEKRIVLAVDESFNVKNPEAQRTGALLELREYCGRAFVLCGTPAPNSADDVISQIDLVDFGRAFGGVRLPDDEDRLAFIKAIIERDVVYTRNLKQNVLTLPARMFTQIEVELDGRQGSLYSELAGELANDLLSSTDTSFRSNYANFLARRAALLRVCSDPHGVDPTVTDTPSKIRVLDELLAAWMLREEKVVIWSYYRATLDLIHQRYSHYGVARVDGSIDKISARREAVRSFQTDPRVRIFLGNPAAAGAGITLHTAAINVYESLSSQAAHYLQSLDRTHRRGQNREVEYFTLVSAGTIEVAEHARLEHKAATQASLLGDPSAGFVTRELMLAEILGADRAGGRRAE